MGTEIELKLRLPPERLARVDAALAGRGAARRIGLVATYWDTPGQALASARLALRVRREGRLRVQTLKGAGPDGLTRFEHEVPAPPGGVPDPALHAGSPAGERLRAVLAAVPGEALAARFTTEVMRRSCVVRTRDGRVELALDRGRIVAGERIRPVGELEIELRQGTPLAVIGAARRWVDRHGAWIDPRSKADVGVRLALGLDVGEPVRAAPLQLEASMSPDAALRAMVRNGLEQVLGNAAELADGTGTPEHLHQLRVGLRRLRTALREFAAAVGDVDPAWNERLAQVFAALAAQRDRDALAAGVWAALQAAGGPAPDAPPPEAVDDTAAALRAAPFNRLMLDLLAFAHGAPGVPPPAAPPLRAAVAQRLRRLRRQVLADAKGFAALDEPAQHRVRKRLKRLRYGLEFAADLFPARSVQAFLRALRPAQEALGELNDLAVARAQLVARGGADPTLWFGLGWIAARRAAVAARCETALRRIARAPRPWKKRKG